MFKNQLGPFRCLCGQTFNLSNEASFKDHILGCEQFQRKSPLTKFFNELQIERLDVVELQIIKCELEIMLGMVETRVVSKMFEEPEPRMQVEPTNELISCSHCSNLMEVTNIVFLENCPHSFCKTCLGKCITKALKEQKEPSCMTCDHRIPIYEVKSIIGEDRYNTLIDELSLNGLQQTTCVKCNQAFAFEPGSIHGNLKDDMGNLLDKEKETHFAQNRFKCPNCQTEQCRKCKTTPYHLGKTCEDNQRFKEAILCKYCELPIEQFANGLPDICNSPDCVVKLKDACKKILPCGHSCSGFAHEKTCPPCLHEACAQKVAPLLRGQSGNEYCAMCAERLVNAPCVRSITCGHIFHVQCMTKKIMTRWHRPRITFGFCLCPLECRQWLQFPPESPLQGLMNQYVKLFEDIKRKSMERLTYEKRDKDERLHKKGDHYYQKPVEYSMAIYSYYECFKCKKPYFGGLKKCEDMMQEDNKNDGFKPEELVCAECANVGITLQNCPKHGKEFIEFKCRFCCSIATWFCWGSTHFCEPCHKRQCEGDYVSKYTKDKLPKCEGKKSCPLKVDHKGNGEEFALGCALCRNLVNSHDF